MSASNRAIVQQLFNELDNCDISGVRKYFSDDAIYHSPLVGDIQGEALEKFFASLCTAFPDAKRSVEDQFTDDIHVVTRWKVTATHQGDFLGIAPTGKRITVTGISIHRISGGKIVEEWQQWDSLGLMQQLGVVPTVKFETKAA